jgi:hypothetical protein
MATLYFLLAKDEERRMLAQFGETYREYMDRTGMFLPKAAEAAVGRALPIRNTAIRTAVLLLLLFSGTVGGAFALRAYTINHLPLWSDGAVTALAILPEDLVMIDHRMASVLEIPRIKAELERQRGPFLAYVMPRDYVMQGMIADTGGEWQLYKRHHTIAMIGDWIFHPFRHLESAHAAMHHAAADGPERHGAGNDRVRRIIFLSVEGQSGSPNPGGLFSINARRTPVVMADVDIPGLALQDVRDLPTDTGWGRVPTPSF